MGDLHHLIQNHGRQQARRLAPDRGAAIDIAAAILEEDSDRLGITYSGFCLTGLPHRRLPNDAVWSRSQGRVTLLVAPGHDRRRGGTFEPVGVPYGAKARLILLYLQTRAVQDNSVEVELGRSMNGWLARMGITAGGSTYRAVQDQATRINLCQLTIHWDGDRASGFAKESIVDGGIRFRADDDRQGDLWRETVTLSRSFFDALRRHPVPVWEPAIRHLSGNSMALDVYVWLAYRLHALDRATPVGWAALFAQFGGGYKAAFHFRPEFRRALDLALAAYPEAEVTVGDDGVVLHPSRPPVPARAAARLGIT